MWEGSEALEASQEVAAVEAGLPPAMLRGPWKSMRRCAATAEAAAARATRRILVKVAEEVVKKMRKRWGAGDVEAEAEGGPAQGDGTAIGAAVQLEARWMTR